MQTMAHPRRPNRSHLPGILGSALLLTTACPSLDTGTSFGPVDESSGGGSATGGADDANDGMDAADATADGTDGATGGTTGGQATEGDADTATGGAGACEPLAEDDECGACLKASCCDQSTSCSEDAACTCFQDCTRTMGPEMAMACAETCMVDPLDTESITGQLSTCATDTCPSC
jgi:hypothetical protein